jgi:hypothetical protein
LLKEQDANYLLVLIHWFDHGCANLWTIIMCMYLWILYIYYPSVNCSSATSCAIRCNSLYSACTGSNTYMVVVVVHVSWPAVQLIHRHVMFITTKLIAHMRWVNIESYRWSPSYPVLWLFILAANTFIYIDIFYFIVFKACIVNRSKSYQMFHRD